MNSTVTIHKTRNGFLLRNFFHLKRASVLLTFIEYPTCFDSVLIYPQGHESQSGFSDLLRSGYKVIHALLP
jgi:hypothetical protein